jgi:glucose/arabinose dehydrogenase
MTRTGRIYSSTHARLLAAVLLAANPLAGCGGDDDDGGSGGSSGASSGAGTSGDGAGGASGRGASGAGGAGQGGSGAGNSGAGQGGSGAGNSGGGSGGSAGSMDGGTDDAGDDAGMPTATTCRAPTPAAAPNITCPTADPVPLSAELVADGLDIPIFVTSAPGDDTRLFVAERNGRIVIIDPQSGDEVSDFIDLDSDAVEFLVETSSNINTEYGLLGLAFHPNYPTDPRFFVNYTSQDPGARTTMIVSFEVSAGDPNVADTDSGQVIYQFTQPQANHNGGMLAFGPDGCLFVGTGDGGNSDDMGSGHPSEGNGQNLDTPLGKLLRFDVDDPTTGAPGNLDGAGNPHIWDYGLRNPWRFSFDRTTGDLYIGDVGQGAWEEVDVARAGHGHFNWGWKIAEGNHCRPGGGGSCDMNGLAPAVDEVAHGNGDDCMVGGYVYRGSAIPSLQGWYLHGDNGPGRRIRAFYWDGTDGRCNDETLVLGEAGDNTGIELGGEITSFGEDSSGELYITTNGNANGSPSGSVYRIVAR